MLWSNVKLIFQRETRDQLRDRRTLFTIAVLPLILYPLMGMAMLQVAQFTREHSTRVWMVGTENLPQSPALLVDGQLNPAWLSNENGDLLQIEKPLASDKKFQELLQKAQSDKSMPRDLVNQVISREMKSRGYDLAVFHLTKAEKEAEAAESDDVPKASIVVLHNSANDRSTVGADRISRILKRWRNGIIRDSLHERGLPTALIGGVSIQRENVAPRAKVHAATWSKILPFIVIVWALTGAFYPAIDLCAGEKERGTFETLLSSPAGRNEIAIGKLLTVMSFSIVTSLLNLFSMASTGLYVASKMGSTVGGGLGGLGVPPISSLAWLVLALIPISALFSAIALAAAAFARSSKEGQYYLIPLMMISMPLMMLPMLPGAHLDLGTSLIPVSGLMLLLRGLIEGQYSEVLPYAAPVCMVTFTCCYLAIRWVVRQFNSESVLFRASEKFAIGSWLQQVMRDRNDLPSVGNAFLLGLLVLLLGFFVQLAVGSSIPTTWLDLSKTILIVLVATIGLPAVLMAMFLTRNPMKSLRLNRCTISSACAAVLMAICFHPMVTWFTGFVLYVYPLQGDASGKAEFVSGLVDQAPGLWAVLLLMAVAPAVFEELAFRGFILSGLEGLKKRWQAIIVTSLLFGVAHFAIQQSIITFAIGMILGVIALETRSIFPCMLYHITHNSISILLPRVDAAIVEGSPVLPWVLHTNDGTIWQYSILPGITMTLFGALLMLWFIKHPSPQDNSELLVSENPTFKPAKAAASK